RPREYGTATHTTWIGSALCRSSQHHVSTDIELGQDMHVASVSQLSIKPIVGHSTCHCKEFCRASIGLHDGCCGRVSGEAVKIAIQCLVEHPNPRLRYWMIAI